MDDTSKPRPPKQAESPQVFYERITKRADMRHLLTTLAKL